MPYTPPSQRSPAASAPVSPDISRRPSFQTGARPALPRSASYLTKHRRTPSAPSLPNNGPSDQPTPVATVEDLKGLVANPSIRQSPPPVSDDRSMPKGAIISPPESSSDEDEMPEVRGRRIENLKELHDAISQIPQHRESSPDKATSSVVLVVPPKSVAMADGIRLSRSSGALDELATQAQRRVPSHARSITEPNVLITKSADASLTPSEEESDDETPRKPQMVRKKSGELVRPALRPSSRRRPSSMPGTPTFSKAVHFDSHLEHVRHFLQVDRPLAVSAGSSPVDNYDSDTEYPFNNDGRTGTRSPPYEWEIIMNNFPVETPVRKSQPVRLERVWLSSDQKSLLGSVAVANLAFQKHVTCRFTLDYWKTTSEVGAEFSSEIRPRETPEGHDRFNFCIKLSDLANLESKTLFFCIRYNVNGQEFWDSNGGANFQVDFRKKMLPQNGKKGAIGAATRPANGLPRSTRRSNPSSAPRPKSMPVGMDEFGENGKLNFGQSIHDYLGESGPALRLKTSRSSANLPSDNLPSRLAPPSGQAFANRYDFGASLTAAVQAAKDAVTTKGDGLYMKPHQRSTVPSAANPSRAAIKDPNTASDNAVIPTSKALPPVTGVDSPSGSIINSASYEELVNKYCFFGSKQSSPQIRDGTLRNGRFDGGDETRATNSTDSSANGSPLQVSGPHGNSQVGQHRMYQPQNHNPYFAQTLGNMAFCASPVETQAASLRLPSSNERASSPANAQPRSSAPAPPTGRSASPASLAGNFPSYAGTSPPNEFPYQHLHDRFPFSGTDAHTATAIRG